MYLHFILFFVSLIGIVLIILRKLAPIRNGQAVKFNHFDPLVPDFEKVKDLTSKNTKKYGYLALVNILRFYIRFSNISRLKYEDLKTKIRKMKRKGRNGEKTTEKKEENKFLKMITDYKYKIRNIKAKIKEEEGVE